MPAIPVVFIDTSVLLNLLRVPGRCDRAAEAQAEFRRLVTVGAKFVIPVTALIETGNFVAQCGGDRRGAADRFCKAVSAARAESPPWTIRDFAWDARLIDELLSGNGTEQELRHHLTNGTLGTGDMAILVERDAFLRETAFTDVRVWTFDGGLASYS